MLAPLIKLAVRSCTHEMKRSEVDKSCRWVYYYSGVVFMSMNIGFEINFELNKSVSSVL